MNHRFLACMFKDYPLSPPRSGFTLIELISCIVLLGVLSAVVVPRFMRVNSQANNAVLETMGGAILTAANLVYAKALIQGVQAEHAAGVDLDGDGVDDVDVQYGYPSGSRTNGVSKIMGGSFASEWTWSTNSSHSQFWLTTATLGGRSGVYINRTAVLKSGCYLLYNPANAVGDTPEINYVTTDC